jgi:hypothetical protein
VYTGHRPYAFYIPVLPEIFHSRLNCRGIEGLGITGYDRVALALSNVSFSGKLLFDKPGVKPVYNKAGGSVPSDLQPGSIIKI